MQPDRQVLRLRSDCAPAPAGASLTGRTPREAEMGPRYTRAERRELAFVLGVAVFGIALVLLVAFVPWYGPVVIG